MKVIPVVAACIFRKDNKILLTKRYSDSIHRNNKWEFPGGKIEPGETPQAALEREILEELNCHIKVHNLVYIHITKFPKERKYYLIIFYKCTLTNCFSVCTPINLILDNKMIWTTPQDVANLETLPGDKIAAQVLQGAPP